MHTSKKNAPSILHGRTMKASAAGLALCLVLTACAGSVGADTAVENGTSVEPRASFEEYREALSGLNETTLTFQGSASSPNSISADRDKAFKQNVEKASGGKIKIELVYGQAIASFAEVDKALVDGRVDIAYTLPIYDPTNYPVYSAFVASTTLAPPSPQEQELATNAAMLEVAWNSDELLEEFELKGLHALIPFNADATVLSMCTEPGTDKDDWHGRQVRVSSAAQVHQVTALGSTPASMAFPEIYEALERNALDCTLMTAMQGYSTGIVEAASNLSFPKESSFTRGAGAFMAGSDYAALPLAGRQLIFDQMTDVFMHSRKSDLKANAMAARMVQEQGGEFKPLDDQSDHIISEISSSLVDAEITKGVVPKGFKSQVQETMDKWDGIVEGMGYADSGSFDDYADWHDPEMDLLPFAERVYEEAMLKHRPS